MIKIFKVEEVFWTVSGKLGVSGWQENDELSVKIGDEVKIIKPDGTIINAQVIGIYNSLKIPKYYLGDRKISGLLLKDLSKEEAPIKSEIFLIESVTKNI